MYRKILLSLISTLIIFGTGIYLNVSMSLLMFAVISYVLPLMGNIVIDYYVQTENVLIGSGIISTITTTGYAIFAILMENNINFDGFIRQHTYRSGNMTMGLEPELADMSQVIFVFALNLSVLYFIQYLSRGDFSHVRRK